MNKLPVKNIELWNLANPKIYKFFWRKPHKKNPAHEEIIYFNYDIFHYFNRALHPEATTKEGIEVKYLINSGESSATIFDRIKSNFYDEKFTNYK